MARKRINKKFLIILCTVAALPVLALGAYVVLPKMGFPQIKWLVRGTPAVHAAEAKKLYEAGEFAKAGEKYKRAMQLKGAPDAAMYTSLGDCYARMVLLDQMNLMTSRACYEQALVVDPAHMPALLKLLEFYENWAESDRGLTAAPRWDKVEEYSKRILGLDPSNAVARKAKNRAILVRASVGVESDQQRIDDAIMDMQRAAEGPPFDAEALFYVCQGQIMKGAAKLRQNDRPGANAIFNETAKMLDDAVAAHPEDAKLHFRTAAILDLLGRHTVTAGQPPKYKERVRDEYEKAAILIKKDDPDYAEVKLIHCKQVEKQGKAAETMKLFRELLAECPDELMVRTYFAEHLRLNPATLSEAVEILEKAPPPDPAKAVGFRLWIVKGQQMMAQATLINIKLEMLGNAKDRPQYDALLKEIDEGYAKLGTGIGAEHPAALLIKGQIELARDSVQAVQTLDRAVNIATPETPFEADQYYKTMFTLAKACMLTNQTGRAKSLLQQLVKDFEMYAPARFLLVQLLVKERDMDEARRQIDILAKAAKPDSPVIIRLMISTMDVVKDKDKIAELYAKLPETSPLEAFEKAQVAIAVGRKDEGKRLLEGVLAKHPDTPQVQVQLARVYADVGDKDKALAIVDSLLAKSPGRADLTVLRAQIAGEEMANITRELVEKETDPFRKEMMTFELLFRDDKPDEALVHIKNAAKLQPENGKVIEILFQYAIRDKQWDQAAAYIETLAKMNQDQAGGLLYRVRYHLARGDLPTSADLAQQLTKNMPAFAQSWLVLAEVQMAQGKYADAGQNFAAALSRQAQSFDALKGLISCSYYQNKPEVARNYIEQGRRIFPNNARLKELELMHEQEWGDPEKVLAPRQLALKEALESKDPDDDVRTLMALGNAYYVTALKKTGDAQRPFLEKARDTYIQGIQKWPDDGRFVKNYADTCLQLRAYADGEKAIQALRARPDWQNKPEPTLMLGEYYVRTNKPAEQEKVLREYLATSPHAVPAQLQLSMLLARQRKLDDALKVLEPNADVPEIRKQRIELQINSGRLADAEKEIAAVLATTDKPSTMLLNRQAYIYMNSGRATEALQILDKVLAAEPQNGEALLYRAGIYVGASRNLDVAIRDLQLVRDATDNSDARMLLSRAYAEMGDYDNAMREMEALVRSKPNERAPRLALVDFYVTAQPPRWPAAERILREARELPGMANDVTLIAAEAKLWLRDKHTDASKAIELIQQGIKLAPEDLRLRQMQLEALFKLGQHRQIITLTDPQVQAKKAPAWVYEYRGRAQKELGDKALALEELSAGIDVAAAQRDDDGVEKLVRAIAEVIGIPAAKARVVTRADKGENRWRMVMALLLELENDIPGALDWVEKVMNDPSLTPPMLVAARNRAGTLYLKKDPPDTAKAAQVYKKLLEQNPDDLTSLNNLACTMILPGSGYTAKDALPHSQRAMELVDQGGANFLDLKPFIMDTHGYVLVLLGRLDEGTSLLRQAIDRKGIPEAYYHLGEAFMSFNPPSQGDAEQAYKRALDLLDKATRENTPMDSTLKAKVEKGLERTKQPGPATAPN